MFFCNHQQVLQLCRHVTQLLGFLIDTFLCKTYFFIVSYCLQKLFLILLIFLSCFIQGAQVCWYSADTFRFEWEYRLGISSFTVPQSVSSYNWWSHWEFSNKYVGSSQGFPVLIAFCSRMDHVVYYKVFISLEGSSYTQCSWNI